jgi:hypothetical protein
MLILARKFLMVKQSHYTRALVEEYELLDTKEYVVF